MVADSLTAKQRRFVSAYLGDAEGNATESARLAGYAGNANTLGVTGFENLRNPKISAAIRSALAAVDRRGIALKQRRINAKVERWQAIQAVRQARAAAFREEFANDPHAILPPGWESGFHVRQLRAIPAGRGETTIVEEFALDATMLREFNTLEKDIGHELGELEAGVHVKHSGRVDHEHRAGPDFSALTMQEQFDLDQMLAKVTSS